MAKLGKTIQLIRSKLDLSQEAFAEKLGIGDRSMISKWENDKFLPDLASARKLIASLDTLPKESLLAFAEAYLLPDPHSDMSLRAPIVGVSVPRVADFSFWSVVVGAIDSAASGRGYSILLCQYDNEDIDQQLQHLALFRDTVPIVGLIIALASGTMAPPSSRMVKRIGTTLDGLAQPIVLLDRQLTDLPNKYPYIGIDNSKAARAAVRHLVNEGHRRIAGVFSLAHTSTQHERAAGYRLALKECDLPPDERLVKFCKAVPRWSMSPDPNAQDARETIRELLQLPANEQPTAILCGTHYLTVLAHELTHGTGIAIMGWDSVPELQSALFDVPLVTYKITELGRRALQTIHELRFIPDRQPAWIEQKQPNYIPVEIKKGPGDIVSVDSILQEGKGSGVPSAPPGPV